MRDAAARACARTVHPIAERIDREAQDVEADGDVADRGRREGAWRDATRARRSQPRPEIGGQPQQIGEHAAGGHLRARARALHDQRIVAVARGRKAHDVVGQRDVGEGMLRVELHQAHGRLALGA